MSFPIKALRQELADLTVRNRGIAASVAVEHRDYTADENQEFARNAARLKEVEEQIKTVEAAMEHERKTGEHLYGPEGEPGGGSHIKSANAPLDGNGAAGHPSHGRGPKFRDLFGASVDNGGFGGGFNEFLASVHSGLADPRLAPAFFAAASTEGAPASAGFLVPTEFAAEVLDASLENEIVRPRANVTPMLTQTKKIAGVDVKSPSSAFGADAEWLSELSTATDRALQVRQIELNARKLALFAAASNELVADGTSFEIQLSEAMVKGLGWGLDYAFLQGDGASKPLGVLNATSLITVAKETGQIASTIVYENLAKMFARIHPACFGNSTWISNSSAIPQLLQINVAFGTGGIHYPVLRESSGQFYIFTRPVIFTEKLPALGAKGDIILADLSQYAVGLRKEVSLEKSIHIGWQKDQANYRCILRADGQPRWASVYTPKAGDTLSWAVTLAARA